MERCPICQTLFGKRKRCQRCNPSRKRTGEFRKCQECAKEFYAAAWQLRDTARRQGTYCSTECRHKAMRLLSAKPENKWLNHNGYVMAWAPDHPRASRGRVLEHILVVEQVLGRPLEPGEQVHHKDGNKQNNAPENLQVMSASEHKRHHLKEYWAEHGRQVLLHCQECGAEFSVKASRAHATNPKNQRKYCSRACYGKSWRRQMDALRAS